MSHLQSDTSGGHLPVHAFYIPPQAAHVALATSSTAHKVTMNTKQKLVFATPTATRSFRVIQTASMIPTHVQHSKGYSSFASTSSSMPYPSIAMLPPSINPPPYDSSFDNDKSASISDNGNNAPWLAPLLGVSGAMGVIIVAIIFFVRRRRYKLSSRSVVPNGHRNPRYPKPITANKHSSWASLSTINTCAGVGAGTATTMSGEEKTSVHMLQPPPAYSMTTTGKTPVRQKRLTADTLVDKPSLSMLKLQYSPQLAFSPSLVAGEFQQQLNHPPLPNTGALSPSNTLIDNAGVLSNEKNQNYYTCDTQQQRIKIEMYDPQVNLNDAGMDGEEDDEDGFGTPYNKSYPNLQEEKVNAAASEGDKHVTAAGATAATEHQVINMSNTSKQW
ncbi:Plasma membrane ATPase [Mucor velutinosus]|uniref:Plasma membrane ATPase n=1 Tax=Mucor velutinosus TaxID=708070 RepID=A0AAN7I1A1_9FUNG|nr:Plasma membrane ATPase [Mucor velutinosus]